MTFTDRPFTRSLLTGLAPTLAAFATIAIFAIEARLAEPSITVVSSTGATLRLPPYAVAYAPMMVFGALHLAGSQLARFDLGLGTRIVFAVVAAAAFVAANFVGGFAGFLAIPMIVGFVIGITIIGIPIALLVAPALAGAMYGTALGALALLGDMVRPREDLWLRWLVYVQGGAAAAIIVFVGAMLAPFEAQAARKLPVAITLTLVAIAAACVWLPQLRIERDDAPSMGGVGRGLAAILVVVGGIVAAQIAVSSSLVAGRHVLPLTGDGVLASLGRLIREGRPSITETMGIAGRTLDRDRLTVLSIARRKDGALREVTVRLPTMADLPRLTRIVIGAAPLVRERLFACREGELPGRRRCLVHQGAERPEGLVTLRVPMVTQDLEFAAEAPADRLVRGFNGQHCAILLEDWAGPGSFTEAWGTCDALAADWPGIAVRLRTRLDAVVPLARTASATAAPLR